MGSKWDEEVALRDWGLEEGGRDGPKAPSEMRAQHGSSLPGPWL